MLHLVLRQVDIGYTDPHKVCQAQIFSRYTFLWEGGSRQPQALAVWAVGSLVCPHAGGAARGMGVADTPAAIGKGPFRGKECAAGRQRAPGARASDPEGTDGRTPRRGVARRAGLWGEGLAAPFPESLGKGVWLRLARWQNSAGRSRGLPPPFPRPRGYADPAASMAAALEQGLPNSPALPDRPAPRPGSLARRQARAPRV